MAETDPAWTAVNEKLDLVARLLSYLVAAQPDNLERRAVTLNALGLEPAQIARVCNTTANTIRVRLAEAKKKLQGKKKRRSR